MGGPQPGAVITVEVLVEDHVVTPSCVVLQPGDRAEARPPTIRAAQEQGDQASAQVVGALGKACRVPAAGGVLDLDLCADGMGVALEAAQDQVVHGHPDRPAPVGVAAEHPGRRLRGFVVDRHLTTSQLHPHGVVLVVLRQRPQTVRGEELVLVEHTA